MLQKTRELFERVAGPLRLVSERLAVGRCPSCNTQDSLFIDLKTGDWRCGRLPNSVLGLIGGETSTTQQCCEAEHISGTDSPTSRNLSRRS